MDDLDGVNSDHEEMCKILLMNHGGSDVVKDDEQQMCKEHENHSLPGKVEFGKVASLFLSKSGDCHIPLPDHMFENIKCPVCREYKKSGVFIIKI